MNVYCTSKAKDKYYEGRLELVLDKHSVEREVRVYTDTRTERSMVVIFDFDSTSVYDNEKFVGL